MKCRGGILVSAFYFFPNVRHGGERAHGVGEVVVFATFSASVGMIYQLTFVTPIVLLPSLRSIPPFVRGSMLFEARSKGIVVAEACVAHCGFFKGVA